MVAQQCLGVYCIYFTLYWYPTRFALDCELYAMSKMDGIAGDGGHGYLKEQLWWAGMVLSKCIESQPQLLHVFHPQWPLERRAISLPTHMHRPLWSLLWAQSASSSGERIDID